MLRKSAVALALLLLMLSSRLYALGLGEIEMHSALNQPMNADISLISAAGVDVSQIRITLASPEAHQRLGLSRAKILTDFRFAIVEDGKPHIHISSTDLVREPYLEFLLELRWENGQMVREYTVLVDPPVTMLAAPVAPVAPVVRAPEPAPARVEPVRQAPPAPVRSPAATAYTPPPARNRSVDQYGPVRRDEALWSLAKRLRPDESISVQQMMLALLRANPDAFVDNNINNLKAGATLKIPDRDAILSLNRAQAYAEASRQYREWKEQRQTDTGAGSEPVAAKTAAETPTEEPPTAETPVEETLVEEMPDTEIPAAAAEAVARTETRLKLTPPEDGPVAGSASGSEGGESDTEASGGESIQQQLTLATEEIEAGRAESAELRSRLLELETQIDKMQRLLELKSEELASMQNRSADQVAASGEPAIADEEPTSATTEDQEQAAAGKENMAEDAVTGGEEAAPVIGPRGIVDRLIDNPVLAGLGVLVAILLVGFLWGSRRQHSSTGMFDDEMTLDKHLTGVSGEMSASAEPPLNISDPGEYQEDTSENMQTTAPDEATDPITEADVYLAYGRVQQAEDVLHAALRDDPENLAVRTKLLRLYHAEGNAEAFESAARVYREAFPEDDSQWEKIAAMGNDLSPGNELYRLEKPEAGDVADMGLSGLEEVSLQDIVTEDEGAGTAAFDDQLPDDLEFAMDDSIEDEIESEGLLASSDEVATKLDLARAYLDMEDPEGARSILQEVLEEGNEEQKNEAESLISKIA